MNCKKLLCAGVVPYRIAHDAPEFLLIRHVHGHWEFPKGKVEPGETVEQAALRELYEEAGVRSVLVPGFVYDSSYVYVDAHGMSIAKTIHFFIGLVAESNGVISHEHTDLQWLPYEQALACLTHAESKDLLTKVFSVLSQYKEC